MKKLSPEFEEQVTRFKRLYRKAAYGFARDGGGEAKFKIHFHSTEINDRVKYIYVSFSRLSGLTLENIEAIRSEARCSMKNYCPEFEDKREDGFYYLKAAELKPYYEVIRWLSHSTSSKLKDREFNKESGKLSYCIEINDKIERIIFITQFKSFIIDEDVNDTSSCVYLEFTITS